MNDGGLVHQTRSREMSRSIVRIAGRGKKQGRVGAAASAEMERRLLELDSRVEMIQALIPLGLKAVEELLQEEVTALAGARSIGAVRADLSAVRPSSGRAGPGDLSPGRAGAVPGAHPSAESPLRARHRGEFFNEA